MASRSTYCSTTVGELGQVVLGVTRDSPLLCPITPPLLLQHLWECVEPESPKAAWHTWVEPEGQCCSVPAPPHKGSPCALYGGLGATIISCRVK